MFLTHDEVSELTGAKTKAGQIHNLRLNGIRHTIKRNGWPSVTRAAVISDTSSSHARAPAPTWAPAKVY